MAGQKIPSSAQWSETGAGTAVALASAYLAESGGFYGFTTTPPEADAAFAESAGFLGVDTTITTNPAVKVVAVPPDSIYLY